MSYAFTQDVPIDAAFCVAFVQLEPKQRLGLLITVVFITGVLILAIVFQRIAILAFLGLAFPLSLPFQRRKPAAGPAGPAT